MESVRGSAFSSSSLSNRRAPVLQNRAFQKVTPGTSASLNAWATVGTSSISVVAASPAISSALPNALQVVVNESDAGVSNAG